MDRRDSPPDYNPKPWQMERDEARRDQLEAKRTARKAEILAEIFQGRGEFWEDERRDIIETVRLAYIDPSLDHAARWQKIEEVIIAAARKWALDEVSYP